ncbi:MAG: SMR family transporter [Bryobacteraceae bacterium]
MVSLLLALAAAGAYVAGGVFMKESAGLTRWPPALGVFACFVAGSALQAVSMRDSDMSANYVIVLGLEAALALALGAVVLGEPVSWTKLAGVGLVVAGVAILRVV